MKLPSTLYNWTSVIGAVIAIISLFMIVFLIAISLFIEVTSSYLGIVIYIILPIFLILGLILIPIGMVRRRRRMRQLEWALLLFALSSVAMYCYLGEKVPWLGVHQVWAFLPLAGMQLARTFGPHGRWWSRALFARTSSSG